MITTAGAGAVTTSGAAAWGLGITANGWTIGTIGWTITGWAIPRGIDFEEVVAVEGVSSWAWGDWVEGIWTDGDDVEDFNPLGGGPQDCWLVDNPIRPREKKESRKEKKNMSISHHRLKQYLISYWNEEGNEKVTLKWDERLT